MVGDGDTVAVCRWAHAPETTQKKIWFSSSDYFAKHKDSESKRRTPKTVGFCRETLVLAFACRALSAVNILGA